MVNWTRFRKTAMALLSLGAVLVLLACAPMAEAQPSGAELNGILSQMNEASAKFRSAKADFQWDLFERVVSSTDTQTGTIYFVRSDGETEMAADIKTYDGQPSPKTVVFRKGLLQLYQPKINQLTVIHARDKKALYESYVTLGFGGSGEDLKKNWNITYQGMETIDGVRTAKLDLVSKSEAVRKNFSHVTIWVDPTRGISLKQMFFQPSGDTRTAYYRHIQYNKRISSSVFKIKTDSKTQVVEK